MFRSIFHARWLCLLVGLFVLGPACTSPEPDLSTELRQSPIRSVDDAININTATLDQLESLPEIGPLMAAKIIEHRRRYGPFRRPEHIIIVEGMSAERFEKMRMFITVD